MSAATQPHYLSLPLGGVRTFRCSCGERFRVAWRAQIHSDVSNVFWRHETGSDERQETRLRLAPWLDPAHD